MDLTIWLLQRGKEDQKPGGPMFEQKLMLQGWLGGWGERKVEGIAHFKLMTSTPVVEAIARELCGAALAQARFG